MQNEFESTIAEIRHLRTGSNFIFSGLRSDPDAIKSIEGVTKCWVEEAHTVSQASIDILTPTIRADNSEIWFSYNPRFDDDPVHAMFADPPPRSVVVDCQYWDNPWFPEVLREEMEHCKSRDYDKYLHIWEGKTQQMSEAVVFRGRYRVDCFETPPDAEFYFGADWGFSVDPSVLVRCFIHGRTLYIDHEAYGIGVEIDKTPDLFDKIPGSRRWRITADSARPETISYMKRHGFKVDGAAKGKDSVIEGIEFLKNYDIVCHERCKNTAYELGCYSYKTDKLTGDVLPVLEDKNNNCIDSLRYAIERVRKANKFMVS